MWNQNNNNLPRWKIASWTHKNPFFLQLTLCFVSDYYSISGWLLSKNEIHYGEQKHYNYDRKCKISIYLYVVCVAVDTHKPDAFFTTTKNSSNQIVCPFKKKNTLFNRAVQSPSECRRLSRSRTVNIIFIYLLISYEQKTIQQIIFNLITKHILMDDTMILRFV